MENFTYYNPVRLVFGRGTISQLKELVDPKLKILVTYGGGSIKRNGVYDQVSAAFSQHTWQEFGGIEPNPRYETLMQAVELCHSENIEFLLAVGGGSVLDGTKFIAAAVHYKGGDPWEILTAKKPVVTALPLASVMTLPATGSEMNAFAVVSRESTQEKLSFRSEAVFPKFSVLDPTTTFSLPRRQVINGVVDAFTHVMEQYCTYPVEALIQDRFAESILITLIEESPKMLGEVEDYAARANLVFAATNALNTWIACGVPQDWATHAIGHELTALYGIDHAQSLAIVLPSLLRHQLSTKKEKLAQFARRVWNIETGSADYLAREAISKTESWFNKIGMKTRLRDYGIQEIACEKVANRIGDRGVPLGEHGDIDRNKIISILQASL